MLNLRTPFFRAAMVALLAGLCVAWFQPAMIGREQSIDIGNLYPVETGLYGNYQWSQARIPLFAYLSLPADTMLIRLRMSAGPLPANTRSLHAIAAGWTSRFEVSGGTPRIYQYLLAPVGRGLYMAGAIAPLAEGGGRELGVAIYQGTAVPLSPHLWVVLLGIILAAIAGGIAGVYGWRAIVLLAYGLLIYAREPRLFYEPRLWAEEGLIYFSYATTHPWWQVIIAPQLGYYSLFANVSALLASRIVSLLAAPIVTTLLAFLVQLLPAALILWSESPLWAGRFWRRVLAVAVLFIPLSGEVWLNTINSQFHLALAAGIILAISPARGAKGWLYTSLLALIGLSSPSACFLVPAFWLRWRQNKAGLADALTLTIVLLIQIAVALASAANTEMQAVGANSLLWDRIGPNVLWDRTGPNYLPTIALILSLRLVIAPILGLSWTIAVAQQLFVLWSSAGWMYEFVAAVVGTVLGVGILLVRRFDRRSVIHSMLAGIFLLAAGSTIVSLGATRIELLSRLTGSRYYYAPIALLFLVVASWVGSGRRAVIGLLLAIVLSHSVFAYRATLPQAYNWSLWDLEVARWQVEPEYALKIWPRGWRMSIAAVDPPPANSDRAAP